MNAKETLNYMDLHVAAIVAGCEKLAVVEHTERPAAYRELDEIVARRCTYLDDKQREELSNRLRGHMAVGSKINGILWGVSDSDYLTRQHRRGRRLAGER